MPIKSHTSGKDFLHKEIGTIRKRWEGRIKIAAAYPNRYHVGMSNLGFQTIYRLLNSFDEVVCERIFLPENIDNAQPPIKSLESSKLVSDFDILAFSISFENDYPNLLAILKQAGLPLRSKDRSSPHPLVIAGGVSCWLNPEPISDFIDCFLIGEAESLIPGFVDYYDPTAHRTDALETIAREVPGAYVPAFYEATYNPDGTLAGFTTTRDVPPKINRAIQTDLSKSPANSVILTPDTTFSQTFLVEVGRGCPHGCRFCATGYVYRPPRFRPLVQLEQCIQMGAAQTHTIGLVGAAVSDHPDIIKLCQSTNTSEIRLSFSSLRADALTPELLSTLQESGVKTATIAPDAGSERMRHVINKGISEETLLEAAESLVVHGIPNLKLYFMVGLPTEGMEDVESIVCLCKRLKHRFLKSSRARKRIGEITVSLNSFVPKPFTPFQWVAMEELGMLKAKIKRVRQGLKNVSNVRVNADVPRWAYIQALLCRGDRRVARILMMAHQNQNNWAKTFKASSLNSDFYVYRNRDVQELLPWDFIDHGIEKSYLIREHEKALRAETTQGCRVGSCQICGVCQQTDRTPQKNRKKTT
jgi:radical SAM family uncharacterized protein